MGLVRKDYRIVLEAWNKYNGGGPLAEEQIKFLDDMFSLTLYNWYWVNKSMKGRKGMLFFYDKEMVGGEGKYYGFNVEGKYSNTIHVEYTGEEILANRWEIEEMFKSEFDRIGYRNGFIKQNYKCLSVPENTVKGKLKCLTFSPVSNKLYADYGKGSNVVFDDGRWSEIEEDNMERGYMHREVKYLLKKDGNTFSLNSVFGDKELDYKLCREKCESLFERFGYPNRLFTIEDLNFFFHVGKKVGRMGGSKDFEYYKEVFLGSLVVDVTGVDSKGFAILEVSDEMKSKCVQAV